jgi:hypothetical protein
VAPMEAVAVEVLPSVLPLPYIRLDISQDLGV